eukprot:CAMPEP_0113441228 /NCGR_PEP_ID=MMETSP0014_2-20120614/969_1 /TAXON_ID=2857 /ORGANISM="Nitzschia sp." /LENGTH=211 /DNA_ID=CAMNT_0000332055 /DNA_START=208 /DNA_END=843 /DNA_ORIENTATION=- /assembly_acc=CAM_ASM_000159
MPLRPTSREETTLTTTDTMLSLDSDDSTVERLNPTAITRQTNEQNNRQQQVDHEANNRKSSSATAAATTTTAAVNTAQVTTTTATTTTTSSTSSSPSSSGTTITLPPVPKPLNVLCLVLSIAGYLLETTMNVSIAIFGIGVGVGLIIGDTATAVTNSSSSFGSGSNVQQTNMMMTAYPQQQHPGINNNGRDTDINPYHYYANSRSNLLPAQ